MPFISRYLGKPNVVNYKLILYSKKIKNQIDVINVICVF